MNKLVSVYALTISFAPYLSMVTSHMVSGLSAFPCNFDNVSLCVNVYLAFILSKAHIEGFE